MSYSPINPDVFNYAYVGCLYGLSANYAAVTDPNAADYANPAAIAGAFAQAVDQAWDSAEADLLDVGVIQTACTLYWSTRAIDSNSTQYTLAADWVVPAKAIVAMVDAAEAYFAAQGISPLPIPSGSSQGQIVVPNIAALEALGAGLENGVSAQVLSVGAYWVLSTTGGATTDGITLVNGTGGTQWYRSSTFVAPATLQVTAWYVGGEDADDENSGTSSGAPLATVQEIRRRLGTNAPNWTGTVTINLQASLQDTDYIDFQPTGGGSLIVLGTSGMTEVFSGTILDLVARNTGFGTGQQWQMAKWAGAAQYQMIVNTSKGNSVAFVYQVNAESLYFSATCDPLTAGSSFSVTEITSWANGDDIVVYSLPTAAVHRGSFIVTPVLTEDFVWYQHIEFYAPDGFEETIFSEGSKALECAIPGAALISADITGFGVALLNCASEYLIGGSSNALGDYLVVQAGFSTFVEVIGGSFSANFIFGNAFNEIQGSCSLDNVGLAASTGNGLEVYGSCQVTGVLWDATDTSVFAVEGTSRTINGNEGSFESTFTVNTLEINGVSTAYAFTVSESIGEILGNGSGARTLTAAQLDASTGSGGFDGFAFNPGGGSIAQADR